MSTTTTTLTCPTAGCTWTSDCGDAPVTHCRTCGGEGSIEVRSFDEAYHHNNVAWPPRDSVGTHEECRECDGTGEPWETAPRCPYCDAELCVAGEACDVTEPKGVA